MNSIRALVSVACLALLGFSACSTSHSGHGTPSASTPADTNSDAHRGLLAAAQLYDDVFAAQDPVRAATLLADEYQLTDLYGKVTKKAEWIAKARGANGGGEGSKAEVREARVYGHIGIVTGRWRETTVTPATVLQFTTVFVHRDGRWQVLADHATQITR